MHTRHANAQPFKLKRHIGYIAAISIVTFPTAALAIAALSIEFSIAAHGE
jgi:hypothetical protein